MKRHIHLLCLLVALVALVAACSPPRQEISFFVYGDTAEKAAYEALVAGFNRKYPDITVRLVHTPGEDEFRAPSQKDAYRQRLVLNLTSGNAPDVFIISYREYGLFLDRGALEPIDPYLQRSTIIKPGDFYPQAMQPFRSASGVLNCLPQNASALVLYYNKMLFDAAGVAYPAPDWTWDDLRTAARKLTQDTRNPRKAHYGLGIDADLTRLLPFIWQHGATLVDNDAQPTRFTLGTSDAQAAIQQFIDLQARDQITPDEPAAITYPPSDRFITGSIGMILFSRRLTPILRTVSFDWDVAPIPHQSGQPAYSTLFADGYCLTKGSPNKDAAWKLIEYAASVDGQTILAKAGRTVPSMRSVAESADFLNPAVKPANSRLFLDVLPQTRPAPWSGSWADVEEELNRHLQAGFYEGLSAAEVVKRIDQQAAPLLSAKP